MCDPPPVSRGEVSGFVHRAARGNIIFLSLLILGYLLRGPQRRNRIVVTIIASFFFVVYLLQVITLTIVGVTDYVSPISMLGGIIIGVSVLGVVVAFLLTWLTRWSFAEPCAIGVVAVGLGALCIPGLHFLNSSISFPNSTGAALLYTTSPAHDHLTLDVAIEPLHTDGTSPVEDIQINNPADRRIKWVLLLLADARIGLLKATGPKLYDRTPGISVRNINVQASVTGAPTTNVKAQLLFGAIAPHSSAGLDDSIVGEVANATSDRVAATLPRYGQGNLGYVDSRTRSVITNVLGAPPILHKGKYFKVDVQGGLLWPSDSLGQSMPEPVSNPTVRGAIQWSSHSFILAYYSLVNEAGQDETSNALFVFAMLFGVAGAGVLASIHGMLGVVLSRARSSQNRLK
jgi:hypothetical protein